MRPRSGIVSEHLSFKKSLVRCLRWYRSGSRRVFSGTRKAWTREEPEIRAEYKRSPDLGISKGKRLDSSPIFSRSLGEKRPPVRLVSKNRSPEREPSRDGFRGTFHRSLDTGLSTKKCQKPGGVTCGSTK